MATNIKMLTDSGMAYIKANAEKMFQRISANDSNAWMTSIPEIEFVEKKFQIPDFELVENPDLEDKEIAFQNAVSLYENLKHLPRFVLSDVRFWFWLGFQENYKVAKTIRSLKNYQAFLHHWTNQDGDRRGIFFGYFSRNFFWVDLTVDENSVDRYELSRFVLENPQRIRGYTWRASLSNNKTLVRGAIRGEKRALEDFGDKNPDSEDLYSEVAKRLRMFGSIRLLDALSEEEVEQWTYNTIKEIIGESGA